MAISQKLKSFLDASKAKYTVAKHPVVYTAQEIAAAQHVPGRQLAKSVLVKTDQGIALAVLPAIALIDFKKLKAALKTKSVSIGKEADIKVAFPDVEVGAMSPFGNLYGVPVVIDKTLSLAQDIVFNAGSHTETIKMRYADFAKLVKAKSGNFSQPFPSAKPAKKGKAGKGSAKKKTGKRPAAKKKTTKRKKR